MSYGGINKDIYNYAKEKNVSKRERFSKQDFNKI